MPLLLQHRRQPPVEISRLPPARKSRHHWLRQSPPSTLDLGLSLGRQLQQLKALLAAGAEAGELRVEGASADARARSLYELLLTPENIVRTAGTRQAHALARETVLRGAAPRS